MLGIRFKLSTLLTHKDTAKLLETFVKETGKLIETVPPRIHQAVVALQDRRCHDTPLNHITKKIVKQ